MHKFGTALVGHLVEWDLSAPLRGIIVADKHLRKPNFGWFWGRFVVGRREEQKKVCWLCAARRPMRGANKRSMTGAVSVPCLGFYGKGA